MASRVRAHTRKTASGGTTTVKQHSRTGRPRKALISPGHAWKLAKKAFGARKSRRGLAIGLGLLAIVEVTAWLTLTGVSLAIATAAILALGVAAIGAAAGGFRP